MRARNNSYGHPHAEVVERVTCLGIALYGSDVHGAIVVTSDGATFQISTERRGDESASTEARSTAPAPDIGCVDLNAASVEELQQIIHIGESRAHEIVARRPFESVDQLTNVTGIGPARLADIKQEGLACVR